jgi:hypothetical protein
MKTKFIFSLVMILLFNGMKAHPVVLTLKSPDRQIEIRVFMDEQIKWSVHFKNQLIIDKSPISLILENHKILGKDPVLTNLHKDKIKN